MSVDLHMHNVQDIAVRSVHRPGDSDCPEYGTLRIIAVGDRDEKLEIVLFGDSADALRSMLRTSLAVDFSDKVSDAVIAAFNAYASTLQGRTPEDEDPCEACLDALKQDVVNAVTEALR